MPRNKWGKVEKEKKDFSLAKGSSWLTVVGVNNLARKFYFGIFTIFLKNNWIYGNDLSQFGLFFGTHKLYFG